MLIVLLLLEVSCHSSLALVLGNPKRQEGPIFLAKTKETFKFADLQFLQARLDSQKWKNDCQRLLLDAATGSTLFEIDFKSKSSETWSEPNKNIPPSLARCEWLVEVLSHEETAIDLVQSLKDQGGIGVVGSWTMNYTRMHSVRRRGHTVSLNYNLRTLLCSVAQYIHAPAALDPTEASTQLILVETTHQGIYLGRFRLSGPQISWNIPSSWSKRPFHYSSAIHPTVAEILVEILLSMVQSTSNGRLHLLDPTCGSGTFLAFALASGRDIIVEGWDVNPQCVEGATNNLRHAFGHQITATKCTVRAGDSSTLNRYGQDAGLADCLIANLPWGKNTVDYVDQNKKILESVRKRLKDGAPCIFIHKDGNLSNPKVLGTLGYNLLDEAFIPPLDFVLPMSRKKGKTGPVKEQEEDNNDEPNVDSKHQRVTVTRAAAPLEKHK